MGDVVEAVENPGWPYSQRKPALARITRIHSGWLYRLFRGDRYDVEVTDEEAVKQWEKYLKKGPNEDFGQVSDTRKKQWEEFWNFRNEVLGYVTLP